MKNLYINRLLLFVFVAVVGFGCSKDEDEVKVEVKPVDQLVGTYDMTGEVIGEDNSVDITGHVKISKNGEDIIIDLDGKVFPANQINSDDGAIEFNIPKRFIFIDEVAYNMEGEGYLTGSTLFLMLDLVTIGTDISLEMHLMGIKK